MLNTINIILLLAFTLVNNVMMWEALLQTQAREKLFNFNVTLCLVISWTIIVSATVGTAMYLSLREALN